MAASGFSDASLVKQVAVNLFYGWGYNFYRKENQLRADDQLIRSKASWMLGQAAAALSVAEDAYRREHLPPPSRAAPFPDAQAVVNAQALERLGRDLTALASRINAMPVPADDKMTQRYRQEAQTLEHLGACDEQLIGQAEMLRAMIQGGEAIEIVEHLGALNQAVDGLRGTLQARQALLLERTS